MNNNFYPNNSNFAGYQPQQNMMGYQNNQNPNQYNQYQNNPMAGQNMMVNMNQNVQGNYVQNQYNPPMNNQQYNQNNFNQNQNNTIPDQSYTFQGGMIEKPIAQQNPQNIPSQQPQININNQNNSAPLNEPLLTNNKNDQAKQVPLVTGIKNNTTNTHLDLLGLMNCLANSTEGIVTKYRNTNLGLCRECNIEPLFLFRINSPAPGFHNIFAAKDIASMCCLECYCYPTNSTQEIDFRMKYIAPEFNDIDQISPSKGFEVCFIQASKKGKCCPYLFCCCCEYSTLECNYVENKIKLGDLQYKSCTASCADLDIRVINKDYVHKYSITCDGCQCAYCCCVACCCVKNRMEFNIMNQAKSEVLGTIVKEPYGLSADTYNYRINFPKNADAEDKILLMISAMYIDRMNYWLHSYC